ncbi:MAG TPA: MarR family transcriptional regulator [Gemmatimonadaceae bacterium]|jgi:DNA-binding MarR family transcriptional regulator
MSGVRVSVNQSMPTAQPAKPPVTSRGTANTSDDVSTSVDAFRRILRELRVAARKTELATGLSAAQLFVLSTVSDAPGCSVNDIARATMTDRSSVAAIVDRLAEQEYITRDQSGEDKRRASITITTRGRRAMGKSAPAPTALLIDGLRQLSSNQLAGLTKGLVALTESMGIEDEPAGMLFEDPKPARRGRKAI